MNTGNIRGAIKNYTQRESLLSHYDPQKTYDFAVMTFHFRHPRKGDILIDTGFDRSFYAHPLFGNLPFLIRMYQILKRIKYTQEKDEDLSFHLNKYNINPGHVFLTHMHPDVNNHLL